MRLPARIYHLAEAANWPSIQRIGLHSAATLFALAGLSDEDREQLERRQRTEHTVLPGGFHVRDQRPMSPAALAGCLVDMVPEDWYALINSHIFFWIDPNRLNRQRAACASRPQVVLVVDAVTLIAAYEPHVFMTPINTGNARRRPARRGAETFVPYVQWHEAGWNHEAAGLGRSPRAKSHTPVELVVSGSIPDVLRFVVRTEELSAGESFDPNT